jgi:fructan beta-fructosidase
MQRFRNFFVVFFLAACNNASMQSDSEIPEEYSEPHRPEIHFSPKGNWMNDPNGMVFYKGIYHLYYQYYPDSTVWGPMHWGHAISKDLVYWEEQAIALYPDSLGYIFSGSAVVDSNNTSGFAKDGRIPIVAIFTHHDPKGEKENTIDFQNQSIAYSLDEGKTWTKYANNPVIKNPGIRDFRDPKVIWFGESEKWIMTLATKDRVTFYSSKNLKDWVKESEFGEGIGAQGGVWECPDLFPLEYKDQKIWVLLVSINPGGPNGGSATQYFTGHFDGYKFIPHQTETRWIDYGTDNYAGVTWSNTGSKKIFLGWMSNWQYAMKVPTERWRSAMTIPRELGLEKLGDKYFLTSKPVTELSSLQENQIELKNRTVGNNNIAERIGKLKAPARMALSLAKLESFTITISNKTGERIDVGYDKAANNYFIDRTKSGIVNFEKGFAGRHTAPRLSGSEDLNIILILDNSSIEMFADNGLSVMTDIFFPQTPYSNIEISGGDSLLIRSLQYSSMKRIWRKVKN